MTVLALKVSLRWNAFARIRLLEWLGWDHGSVLGACHCFLRIASNLDLWLVFCFDAIRCVQDSAVSVGFSGLLERNYKSLGAFADIRAAICG